MKCMILIRFATPELKTWLLLQALWGEALMRVEEGLMAGRRWLWDEASRRVGVLLAAPSAFQGEQFLQVGNATCRVCY